MLLRWLLPIVAAFALLGNAFSTFAAAGTFGSSTCCCPSPKVCKCHDHDKPKPDATMKRCNGEAVKVQPHLQVAIIPDAIVLEETMLSLVVEHVVPMLSSEISPHPEKPPF